MRCARRRRAALSRRCCEAGRTAATVAARRDRHALAATAAATGRSQQGPCSRYLGSTPRRVQARGGPAWVGYLLRHAGRGARSGARAGTRRGIRSSRGVRDFVGGSVRRCRCGTAAAGRASHAGRGGRAVPAAARGAAAAQHAAAHVGGVPSHFHSVRVVARRSLRAPRGQTDCATCAACAACAAAGARGCAYIGVQGLGCSA